MKCQKQESHAPVAKMELSKLRSLARVMIANASPSVKDSTETPRMGAVGRNTTSRTPPPSGPLFEPLERNEPMNTIYLPGSRASLERVREAVADAYNLTPAELCAEGRAQPMAFARQLGMYIARRMTHASQEEIALAFNRTNHGTAIAAQRRIAKLLRRPKFSEGNKEESNTDELRSLIASIEGKLRMDESTRQKAKA
jgi:hypothetical protein